MVRWKLLGSGFLLLGAGLLFGLSVPGCVPGALVLESGVPPPELVVTVPPPPPRPAETQPMPRPGWTYVSGHWHWDGSTWQWKNGYFIRNKVGYAYNRGRWVVRGAGRYAYIPGWWRPATAPRATVTYRPYQARKKYYYPWKKRQHHRHGHHHPHPPGGHHHHPHGHPHPGGSGGHHHPA